MAGNLAFGVLLVAAGGRWRPCCGDGPTAPGPTWRFGAASVGCDGGGLRRSGTWPRARGATRTPCSRVTRSGTCSTRRRRTCCSGSTPASGSRNEVAVGSRLPSPADIGGGRPVLASVHVASEHRPCPRLRLRARRVGPLSVRRADRSAPTAITALFGTGYARRALARQRRRRGSQPERLGRQARSCWHQTWLDSTGGVLLLDGGTAGRLDGDGGAGSGR